MARVFFECLEPDLQPGPRLECDCEFVPRLGEQVLLTGYAKCLVVHRVYHVLRPGPGGQLRPETGVALIDPLMPPPNP